MTQMHKRRGTPRGNGAQIVNNAGLGPEAAINRVEVRDRRLPPPLAERPKDQEVHTYVIGVLGSEGSHFYQVRLNDNEVRFLRDLRNSMAKDRAKRERNVSEFAPVFEIYHGTLRNVGDTLYPIWEPKGKRVI